MARFSTTKILAGRGLQPAGAAPERTARLEGPAGQVQLSMTSVPVGSGATDCTVVVAPSVMVTLIVRTPSERS